MSTVALLALAASLLLGGALASLACARRRRLAGWVATAAVALASVPLVALVVRAFSAGGGAEATVLRLDVLGAALTLAVDPLSGLFLAVAALLAVLSTLYCVEYMGHYRADGVAKFYPVLLVFFLAVVGVLAARDLLAFLVFWELMTLASFFLVGFESASRESQRAALKYFVMTHAATLCLVAAGLILWRQSGSFHFDALRVELAALLAARPLLGHAVLVLFFLGFATKAGLLPMGVWLPDAHPAAPSGVSAALSGLLVKLGVYGLARVFVTFLPLSPASEVWGIAIAIAGAASLVLGTLAALEQQDDKRLLAYSTIGQIGYVCLALGVGVAFLPGSPALGALGLAAAFLHVVNHACFKACLFLGAGSVLYRTGERDLDRLGGLTASMPVTAGTTTVASLAIAGVPPLNGFVSKWLIVVTCLLGGLQRPLFLLLGLLALFVSLGTLAVFVKVLGTVFLGAPSARTASEVPMPMLVPQIVLAVLCVALGVWPAPPLSLAYRAVSAAVPVGLPSFADLLGGTAGTAVALGGPALAFYAPLAIAVGLAMAAAVAGLLQRTGGAEVRRVPLWACGEEHAVRTLRYGARSFYAPFRHAVAGVYPRLHFDRHPVLPPGLRRALDPDGWLFVPVAGLVERAARRVSRTHTGVPQVYLLWIVLGAIVLVALLLALGR